MPFIIIIIIIFTFSVNDGYFDEGPFAITILEGKRKYFILHWCELVNVWLGDKLLMTIYSNIPIESDR